MAQRKPEQMTDAELFLDWLDWIERVRKELEGLVWNRRMFRDVSKVFEHNAHLQDVGGLVYEWLRLNYSAAAAIAFRREVDRARHMGFVHLLAEMADRPSVFSRRRFYEQWGAPRHGIDEEMRKRAIESIPFVQRTTNSMDDHVDPAVPLADIDTLRGDTEVAQNFVEQTIAHRTRGEPETITIVQFNQAVDAITPIFTRWYARLTLNTVVQLEPTAQFNTHDVFTFPWDVTCDRLWQECRGDRRLPSDEIRAAYGDGKK
jgi:hypothetical protein